MSEGMEVKEKKRVTQEELRGTVNFFSEINVLKRIPRSGWFIEGPSVQKEPDYVAGHGFGVPQITYVLGRMNGLSVEDALIAAGKSAFHDNQETRLPETHKISTQYFKIPKEAVIKAMRDQTRGLPKEIGEEIVGFVTEVNYGDTLEAMIIQDADFLEVSTQAKIFDVRGFSIQEDVLRKYLDENRCQTELAKRLVSLLRRRKDLPTHWWKDLLPKIE